MPASQDKSRALHAVIAPRGARADGGKDPQSITSNDVTSSGPNHVT
jgi:hypothetical protein